MGACPASGRSSAKVVSGVLAVPLLLQRLVVLVVERRVLLLQGLGLEEYVELTVLRITRVDQVAVVASK